MSGSFICAAMRSVAQVGAVMLQIDRDDDVSHRWAGPLKKSSTKLNTTDIEQGNSFLLHLLSETPISQTKPKPPKQKLIQHAS